MMVKTTWHYFVRSSINFLKNGCAAAMGAEPPLLVCGDTTAKAVATSASASIPAISFLFIFLLHLLVLQRVSAVIV